MKMEEEAEQKLKVVVRVRPPVPNDAVLARVHNVSDKSCVSSDGNLLTLQKDPYHFRDFSFEDVLDESAGQEDVYERSCQDIVESFTRDGKDGCVLCYGQSGSGKTFTMFGDRDRDRDRANLSSSPETASSCFGLVQHSLQDVFTYIQNCSDADFEVKVCVSFYEIYLEKIRDLLAPESAISISHHNNAVHGLSIREVPGKGAYVEGLTRVPLDDFFTALKLVRDMKHKRTSKKKQSNGASSRSHAILRISLEHVKSVRQGVARVMFYIVPMFSLLCYC
jgi:hypothetical protein